MSLSGKRVGFILASNSLTPLASTRISVLNMLPFLKAKGYDPLIVFEPSTATETPDLAGLTETMAALDIDIAYFQKVHGVSVHQQLAACKLAGIKTIYGVCDRVDNDMVQAVDITIVVTEFLKQIHAIGIQSRIRVVHDGIERPELALKQYRLSTVTNARPRAAIVTSSALTTIPVLKRWGQRYLDITVIGRYEEHSSLAQTLRTRLRLTFATSKWPDLAQLLGYGFNAEPWHIERVYDYLLQTEIGIIPIDMRPDPLPGHDVSYWEVKSENRLTLLMALGLPVIASPVPAYLNIIEQGVNGYLAHDRGDWIHAMLRLRDAEHRRTIGCAARATVINRYSLQEQARKLISILDELVQPKEKFSVLH